MGFTLAPVHHLWRESKSRLQLYDKGRVFQEQLESTRYLGCVFFAFNNKFFKERLSLWGLKERVETVELLYLKVVVLPATCRV